MPANKKDAMTVPADLLIYGSMSAQERVRARVPRAQRLSSSQQWFRVTDSSDGSPARLDIFDEIGFWGVSASEFNSQLQAVNAPTIDLHVNSPGGDVFDGITILNTLRAHPSRINVTVDGLAASAASFIAQAGDSITMMPNSQLMIHDASGICMGNPADMKAMLELLDKCSDNIASIYANRAGGIAGDWRTAMRAETWYSADEAVAAGLADAVAEPAGGKKPAASDAWNLSFYVYNGRAEAPPPTLGADTAPGMHGNAGLTVLKATVPEGLSLRDPTPEEVQQFKEELLNTFHFDPNEFRAAIRAAVNTEREAAQ